MRHVVFLVVVGLLLWAGHHYLSVERKAAYEQGYATAQAEGATAMAEALRHAAEVRAEMEQQAVANYRAAVARSATAEREWLAEQRRLRTEINTLQEQLHAAYIDTYSPTPEAAPIAVPAIVITAGWLRDYNAALGVTSAVSAATATDTAVSSARGTAATPWPAAGTAAEYTPTEITLRDMLRHAQRYGEWCQDNTQRLVALQQLIRSHHP